jgi:hypothetical protein
MFYLDGLLFKFISIAELHSFIATCYTFPQLISLRTINPLYINLIVHPSDVDKQT